MPFNACGIGSLNLPEPLLRLFDGAPALGVAVSFKTVAKRFLSDALDAEPLSTLSADEDWLGTGNIK